MLFNSLTFFYFFAVVLIVNRWLPESKRNAWILAASFLFYASWSPPFIALLLATAVIDYVIARKMGSLESKHERKPWLAASLTFNIASLFFFKYATMALDTAGTVSTWFGHDLKTPALSIGLPLGISFYTFETISYAVDVYRGELKPKKSFFEYLSFLMFFPKLIAGPIVRASELLHQIPRSRSCTEAQFTSALNLIGMGFFKKVLLADNFAPFVEKIFADPSAHNRIMCIVAVYGYSMQVYFDFSAYSDIARGCARLLGYELPINFDQPYLATSLADFWRRWHMTLSRWLRDYLYIPLGGNSKGKLMMYRNLFITMLVGGLWHGANWTFVLWGAMNGVFLVIERAWYAMRGTKPKRAELMGPVELFIRRFWVFHLITFTRIFFRAPNVDIALNMLKSIYHPQTSIAEPSFGLFAIPAVTIGYLALSPLKKRVHALELNRWHVAVGYAVAIVVLLVFGASQAEFIYFQF